MGDNPKKYHVTDDGDVYRINDDGSFTSMGNAEKMSKSNTINTSDSVNNPTPSNDGPIKPYPKSNSRKQFWVYGLIFIIVVFVTSYFSFFYFPNESKNVTTPIELSNLTVDTIAASTANDTLVEVPNSSSEIISQAAPDLALKDTHQDIPVTKSKESNTKENTPIESQQRTEIRNTNSIDPDKVYYAVEVQAEFPGGDIARRQWIRDNIQWPRDQYGRQLEGGVELEFIIERDGRVSNVRVTYSENPELNSAAISLISSMPKWSPAMVKNQPVRSPMGITLFF